MRKAPMEFIAAAGACAALAAGSALAADHAPVTVNLISAPFGTGSYVISNALEQISKTHPWLRIVSSESPGFVFNIKKLDAEPALKKTTIIGSGPVVSKLAQRGEKPFDKKYAPVKLLANYNLVAIWLATLDPNIRTAADLAGKKLALGRAPQINWAVEPRAVLDYGYGVGGSRINIQYAGPKEAVAALLDGTVDASVVGGYLDPQKSHIALSPQTLEFVASGRKIRHLGFSAEAVKKTAAQGIPIAPYTLPAKSFEGLAEPLPILVDSAAWVAAPEFPDELAYEITKLIIQNVDKFGQYTAIGKLLSHTAMPFGWDPKDIHPGALRAYREAGILK
jgi:TRAP transporter TAXI family solute receptor